MLRIVCHIKVGFTFHVYLTILAIKTFGIADNGTRIGYDSGTICQHQRHLFANRHFDLFIVNISHHFHNFRTVQTVRCILPDYIFNTY